MTFGRILNLIAAEEFIEVVFSTAEMDAVPLKKKSNRFPSYQNFPRFVVFIQKVLNEVRRLSSPNETNCNLSEDQCCELHQLNNLNSIVSKLADKGGNGNFFLMSNPQ